MSGAGDDTGGAGDDTGGARSDTRDDRDLPPRSEDFAAWYDEVVLRARLASPTPLAGCIAIRPYGHRIWELLRRDLERRLEAAGRRTAHFPLLVPRAALEAEGAPVDGAGRAAVVGSVGSEPPDPPVAVRPGAAAAVWPVLAGWIDSYRDLPLRLDQWGSAVRWEPRARPFLRSTEILAHEGHSAHASEEEAEEEARRTLSLYRDFAEDSLALPVVTGERTPGGRGAGALRTWACEALMVDGGSIETGASHHLGRGLARAFDVRFRTREGELEHVWGAACDASTRLVAALVMGHGDDEGLVLPPRVAPHQVVILPRWESDERRALVLEVARRMGNVLGRQVRVHVDDRDGPGPEAKSREWTRRGVPIRMEIGPEEVAAQRVSLVRRVEEEGEPSRRAVKEMEALELVPRLLDRIQRRLLEAARRRRDRRSARGIARLDALAERVQAEGGFAYTGWCGAPTCANEGEAQSGASLRLIPDPPWRSDDAPGRCVTCGGEAEMEVAWARAH